VEGHPAYIVHAAGRGWLDPAPDVVLSGINVGANVGHAVLHSGTVGAALTAARHGWRGLAVSLETAWPPQLLQLTARQPCGDDPRHVRQHPAAQPARTWPAARPCSIR
jgi:5'/3'-nucleotidase SurE